MAETIQETTTTETPTQTAPSPFGSQAWTETPPALEKQEATTDVAPPVTTTNTSTETKDEEILDSKEWFKREFGEFGWNDPEMGKKEIAELRQKSQTQGFKFENEHSEKVFNYLKEGKEDDLYNFLHEKKKVEKLTAAEVNKLSAEEIVKFSYLQKNKELTKDDVDFLFSKKFAVPPQPVKELTDTDEDFAEKMKQWEGQVQNIERELIIEAKLAKPELEKLKTTLVLPDIKKEAPQQAQPDQKELDRLESLRQSFLKKLESDYKNFNGYEVKYKDEEVEIPVNFGLSEDEKVALKKELESFDVDGFIMSRWLDDKGNHNISQIMDDLTLLRNKDKVLQKMVNEVGSKMKEHYIKLKSNVTLNNGQQQTFQPQQQNEQQVSPFSAGAWSEKPPIHQN